jgi:hypothetical protein
VTRPKREKDPTPRVKITAGRDIYHFIPFNNLPDPDSPWKKMKGFWKNENDWADWMKDKSTHK